MIRTSAATGFSLIELMVVVAIIGVLSTIAVPNMADGIKRNLARNHAKSLLRTMSALRITDQGTLTLPEVSGTTCTSCAGGMYAPMNMRGYVPTAGYIQSWKRLGFDAPPRDPWGNVYILDENDMEFGPDCRYDALYSAGADGIWEGPGDGDDVGGDDIIARLAPANQICHGEDPVTGGIP